MFEVQMGLVHVSPPYADYCCGIQTEQAFRFKVDWMLCNIKKCFWESACIYIIIYIYTHYFDLSWLQDPSYLIRSCLTSVNYHRDFLVVMFQGNEVIACQVRSHSTWWPLRLLRTSLNGESGGADIGWEGPVRARFELDRPTWQRLLYWYLLK